MTSTAPFVHPSAVVEDGAELGEGVKVWHFCHVMAGARLGAGSVLGQNCFVAASVRVGVGARVQNNVSLYDGVELGDHVFVGPSVVFTNVRNPRAEFPRKAEYRRTVVERGVSIGANATILPGVRLGAYAFVGAGAVVTKDVAAFELVVGTPARRIGWMSRAGERLEFRGYEARCPLNGELYRLEGHRVELARADDG
ncbi:MAG TPA: acyltransferase [Polyangiaceae bacterium]|nr:acyltransferase [Polyangiaceae bacterium]